MKAVCLFLGLLLAASVAAAPVPSAGGALSEAESRENCESCKREHDGFKNGKGMAPSSADLVALSNDQKVQAIEQALHEQDKQYAATKKSVDSTKLPDGTRVGFKTNNFEVNNWKPMTAPKPYAVRMPSSTDPEHHAAPAAVAVEHPEVKADTVVEHPEVKADPVQLTQAVETVEAQPAAADLETVHLVKDEMNWSKPPRADVAEAQTNLEYIQTKDQPKLNVNVDQEDNLMPTAYDTAFALPDEKQLQRLGMTKDDGKVASSGL